MATAAHDSDRPGVDAPGAIARLRDGRTRLLDLAGDGLRIIQGGLDQPVQRPRIIIELGLSEARLLDCSQPSAVEILGSYDVDDTVSIAADVIAALTTFGYGSLDLGLGFADDLALDLDVSLPKASRRLLDQTIGLHALQHSPYPAEAGLAFWTVDRAGSEARARISLVPAHIVAPVLASLDAAGKMPKVAVRLGTEGSWAAEPEWLRTSAADIGTSSRIRMAFRPDSLPRTARLVLIAAGLILGSGVANLVAGHIQIAALAGSADQANEKARLAQRLQTDAAFLAVRQREAVQRLHVLDELAAKLPDGTWLERIELKDDKLEVVGHAPSAAETLRLVAAIGGVKSAETMSAVVRDQSRNLERFRFSILLGSSTTPASSDNPRKADIKR